MRPYLIVFLAASGVALPAIASAFAQAAPANAAAPPPASPDPPPVAAITPTQPVPKVVAPPDEQLDAKYVRQTCSDFIKSQGLKTEAIAKAVSECVAKVRPDLAGKD